MDDREADRKALEEFVVGNSDLEKLEAMLDRFNIFEAVGMSRQEIRHSTFLAFLLNPNQSHGMGDTFLKRFLQSAVSGSDSAVVTPIELSLWNLDGVTVQREWKHIDIFILDDENRLAVIVENKIGTSEHSGQLERYYDLVLEEYPEYRILAIYLTPDGDEPSHPEYLPLDYGTVCEILDEVRQSRSSVMEPDAAVLAAHYTDMMRRNIVGDSEIARLMQQIYQKHQRAIDLIYEHRFAQQEAIRKLLLSLIREASELSYNTRYSNLPAGEWISFQFENWNVPNLLVARGYAKQNNILLFVIGNLPERLEIYLSLCPGDEETRSRLFVKAIEEPTIFGNCQDTLNGETAIYQKTLLSDNFDQHATPIERETEIRKNWNDFLENDLPRIDAALKAEDWIWEDSETSSG